MEAIKLKFHSLVDVITNSSTTIYTYSDGSVAPAKELVTEFARVMGFTESVDDMFRFIIVCEDDYYYYETEDIEGRPEDEAEQRRIVKAVMKGEISKPQWMLDVEEREDKWSYTTPATDLLIVPLDDKYADLGKALVKFLYSTDHEEVSD